MKGFLKSIRSRAGISQPRPRRKQRVTGQANQPLTGTAQRQKKKALAGLKARTTGSSLPTLGGRVGGPQNPRGAYIGKYTSPRGKAAIGLRKKKAASDLAGQQRRPKRKPRPGGRLGSKWTHVGGSLGNPRPGTGTGGTRRRVPSPGGTRNPNPRRDNLRGVPSRKPAPNMGGTRGGRRPRPERPRSGPVLPPNRPRPIVGSRPRPIKRKTIK